MVHPYMDDIQAIVPLHITSRKYKPGQKVILVSVLLSFLLLMSQIFCGLNLGKPAKVSYSTFHKSLEAATREAEPPPCMKNYLGSQKPPIKPPGTCRHLSPPRGICSLTQELFFDHSPETCNHQKQIQFCKMWKERIKCVLPEECKTRNIFTGSFHHESGETIWEETQFPELEKKLYALSERKYYKGYMFIKCSDNLKQKEDYVGDFLSKEYVEESDPVQLFLYPKPFMERESDPSKNSGINVNIVMIDSVSRNHLYRSLPSSINFLDKLKQKSKITVIDYEYVQAIKQRTYESLKALFSGFVNIYDKPFGTYSLPPAPLPVDVLLGKYKNKGYRTLWLEDMCWKWEWGLPKDLKVVNKSLDTRDLWSRFQKALDKAQIDDVDVTLASCEILKANEVNDPFHSGPVCFNGKFHHEYIFEYLQLYQQRSRKPYFSFSQTNVGHEDTGIRIQSLDVTLKRYLEYAQHLSDTVTILFSDHGNTYGHFLERSPEAYVETFNPFLILIVPDGVKKVMGEVRLKIMEENSANLVSLVDVHEMLLSFIGERNDEGSESFRRRFVIPGGLMSNIPRHRTCADMPLVQPNLCICRDFDILVNVRESHYAYAEFGVGVLNNMMLRGRRKSGSKGFGNCQLLKVKKVRSVKELRTTADVTQYKLDVEVTGVLSSKVELFFLAVEIGAVEPAIRLLSFERNSVYASNEHCKDTGVDIKMCSCEGGTESSKIGFLNFILPDFISFLYSSSFKSNEYARKQIQAFSAGNFPQADIYTEKSYPSRNPCLFIFRHQYSESFNFIGMNKCSTIHKVTLKIRSTNLFLSENSVSDHLLYPLELKHLVGGTQANPKLEYAVTYDIVII